MTSPQDPPQNSQEEIDDFFDEKEITKKRVDPDQTETPPAMPRPVEEPAVREKVLEEPVPEPEEVIETASEELEPEEPEPEVEETIPEEDPAEETAPAPALASPLNEIPITLSVELGKLDMTLQKVMDLAPGAVLDTVQNQEGLVDLVVNGRKVGTGEILKLGNTLGIRIVQIG